jgi:hypothetical protein
MNIRAIINQAQDTMARIGLCQRRQRVWDTIRSWSMSEIQPPLTIGEAGLKELSDSLRRVVMSPTYIRLAADQTRRALYYRPENHKERT